MAVRKTNFITEPFQPYPLSFADEQAGERCHKRSKYGRTYLSRKTSPENNLEDMMRLSLTWSDPKHADQDVPAERSRKRIKDELFERQMTFYYSDQDDRDKADEDDSNVQSDDEEMGDDESNESEEESDEDDTT